MAVITYALSILWLYSLFAHTEAARKTENPYAATASHQSTDASPSSYSPLAPWMKALADNSTIPSCYVFEAAPWGVGSSFLVLFWTAALLRQQKPDITIYYDHVRSPYQCSADGDVTAFLQPKNEILRTSQPPKECERKTFDRSVGETHKVLGSSLGVGVYETLYTTAPAHHSSEKKLMQHLQLDCIFQSVCPVVADFWHLSPELQGRADRIKRQLQGHRAVVAIHARGGDKSAELRDYVDPKTRQYPLAPGMQRLLATQPGLLASPPICIILGDDFHYAHEVRAMAQQILRCNQTIMRSPNSKGAAHHQTRFNILPQEERCAQTKEYLLDIELMAWSTFLIANHRANADTVATFVRKCKYHRAFSTTIPGTGAPRFTLWAP